MIPIPGLESVRSAWLTIEAEGFNLHGFFVYAAGDHYFPEYIEGDGLSELDRWSTNECAIFVVHSPSEQWIKYTKQKDHIWWKMFKDKIGSNPIDVDMFSQYGQTALLQIGDERKTMQEIFAPCLNQFMRGDEIDKILQCFGLRETDSPCIILFKDLFKEGPVWIIRLHKELGLSQDQLSLLFRDWFDTGAFRTILQEARNA